MCNARAAVRVPASAPSRGWTRATSLFAPPFARAADHQRIGDHRVRAQHFFDFLDEHLLAAGVDHQRVAAVQPQRPIRFQRGAVARYHHAFTVDLRKGLAGGVGIVEVPQRNPAFPGGPSHLVLAWGKKVAVVLGQHQSALAQREGVGSGVAVAVPESHVSGLRRPVPVDQSELRQQFQQRLLIFEIRCGTAGADRGQRRQVVAAASQLSDQRPGVGVPDHRHHAPPSRAPRFATPIAGRVSCWCRRARRSGRP